VIVAGGLARRPLNGGAPWVRLQWVLGLRRLGVHVFLVDQLETSAFVDEAGSPGAFESSLNLDHFRLVTRQFGLEDSAALIYGDGKEIFGIQPADLLGIADEAELLINIAGALQWEPMLDRIHRRAYVDVDPGFTQFNAGETDQPLLHRHHFHFSYAQNIALPVCSIPTAPLSWRALRPPVVLEEWPNVSPRVPHGFTTVAAWRGRARGPLEFAGRLFGLKSDEFKNVIELPERVNESFEVALNTRAPEPLLPLAAPQPPPEPETERDLELLRRHGWKLVDPRVVAPDPLAYRRYIQRSAAEFSVAKGIYVDTSSGWVSDRTVCYLASGKPALVQDTGFVRDFPVGEGLLTFRTLEEAVSSAERIAADYEHHSRAARSLAEEYFDSDKIVEGLLAEVGVTP
jgi:hypothetical protein